ncbi:MAG: FlgB family protein [Rhodobacteraceae bacterium]|jgi:flagellar basal-body rod protein FlgB|nr:FlgB family protein [Paracoccaceae bacterium]
MFETLDVFRMAGAMARHAGSRQAVVAGNIANADTPGYRARDVRPFAESYAAPTSPDLRMTRAGHMSLAGPANAPRVIDSPGPSSPNGNTVALETEMFRSVDAKRQHDRALSIYRASLDLIRSSLGRR